MSLVLFSLMENIALKIPVFAMVFINEYVCVSEPVSEWEREGRSEGAREKMYRPEWLGNAYNFPTLMDYL